MNVFRSFVVFIHARALELLLVLSITFLIGQLCWPAVVHWWRLPIPGKTGFDTFQVATLASEFVIQLPQSYRNGLSWPLIVFLHGSGERGNDATVLHGQDLLRQKLPAIVAAPTCLPPCTWEPDAVANLVRYIASRYDVDPKRIYLVGYSMGGYGTWRTAASHPELFAAIVPISGGGDPNDAKTLAAMPVWAFHGEKDKAVPVAESEHLIEAMHKAGGEPRLTILPNEGHGICGTVCYRTDLWEWLFQQRRRQ